MTPDEIQAIREKHFFWKDKECNWDGEPYPCDVIKVLDALESINEPVSPAQTDTQEHPGISASATSDTLPEYECAHQWVHIDGDDGYGATPVAICVKCYAEKTYCAKCGEKL